MKTYFLKDTWIMFTRSMYHIIRSLDTILTITITPLFFLIIFVYVLGGSLGDVSNNYVNYLLPGILVMSVSNGIAYVSIRLFNDVHKGIFERFHSMPIASSSPLWGHVLTSLISNYISLIILIIVAFLMGFHPSATIPNWFAIIGILTLFILALTWIAIITGLIAKTADGASAFAYPLILISFISSAFVPTDTMSTVVRVFAENQPLTAIVDTLRALFYNLPVGNEIWSALAWCIGIIIVAYIIAMRLYNQQSK